MSHVDNKKVRPSTLKGRIVFLILKVPHPLLICKMAPIFGFKFIFYAQVSILRNPCFNVEMNTRSTITFKETVLPINDQCSHYFITVLPGPTVFRHGVQLYRCGDIPGSDQGTRVHLCRRGL